MHVGGLILKNSVKFSDLRVADERKSLSRLHSQHKRVLMPETSALKRLTVANLHF